MNDKKFMHKKPQQSDPTIRRKAPRREGRVVSRVNTKTFSQCLVIFACPYFLFSFPVTGNY